MIDLHFHEISFMKLILCFKITNLSFGTNSKLLNCIFRSHSRSRSWPFPGIPVSHSHSQKSGMQISFPVHFPNIGNAISYSRSHSQKLGMQFSFPFPFPKFGNWLSYSRSRSQSPKSHSRSPLPGRFRQTFFDLQNYLVAILRQTDMSQVKKRDDLIHKENKLEVGGIPVHPGHMAAMQGEEK